jgi:chromate transporter
VSQPSFGEATRAWGRIALLSFGGPAAQIAVMHRIVVEEKGWIDERRFLHALNFCMLLPGPEAMQLATYLGWMLHGIRGGLVAGCLFILPGFLSILALSYMYVWLGDVPAVSGVLFGLKAAVLAIVLVALDRLRRRTLQGPGRLAIALGAFAALFFLALPFPLVILVAAVLGAWLMPPGAGTHVEGRRGESQPGAPGRGLMSTLGIAALGLAFWILPLAAVALALGPAHVLSQVGLFFSKVAVVSFGGAYAVLAYVAQHAVEAQGWLSPAEMVDGLGLAETTPGPLIQVLQFVAFLAAWRDAAPFPPEFAALLASVIATWATFAPSFVWIFTGAPWVDQLLGRPRLAGALAGVGAAVVGAVLNLSLWFALHVVFARVEASHFGLLRVFVPDWRTVEPAAVMLGLLSLWLLTRRGWGMLPVLALAAGIGTGLALLGA